MTNYHVPLDDARLQPLPAPRARASSSRACAVPDGTAEPTSRSKLEHRDCGARVLRLGEGDRQHRTPGARSARARIGELSQPFQSSTRPPAPSGRNTGSEPSARHHNAHPRRARCARDPLRSPSCRSRRRPRRPLAGVAGSRPLTRQWRHDVVDDRGTLALDVADALRRDQRAVVAPRRL